MILLSISPFIFIQCGSGGPVEGTRGQTAQAHPPGPRGPRGGKNIKKIFF